MMVDESVWRKVLEKWWGVWAQGDVDSGASDCAFCELFYANCCIDCPIEKHTSQSDCHGTPYIEFANHQSNPFMKSQGQERNDLALAELRFLISLCPYKGLADEYATKIYYQEDIKPPPKSPIYKG